jgi:nicotinamidase-related amidase
VEQKLAVLVIDVSENWEETLKAHERGAYIEWDYHGKYVKDVELLQKVRLDLEYPHGSIRAGFNALIDTVRIAYECKIPIYAVHTQDGWGDDYTTALSLKPYILSENESSKADFSAFTSFDLNQEDQVAFKLKQASFTHLLIIGYDRDHCVLKSVQDAVSLGYTVITSEHCMLTRPDSRNRDESMEFYRQHTQHIESLEEVWNFIVEYRRGRG